jgi:hypothetical protein
MRVHNMHEFCKSEKSLVHEVPVATTSVSYHGQVTAEEVWAYKMQYLSQRALAEALKSGPHARYFLQ